MGYDSTSKKLSLDGGLSLADVGRCLGSTSGDLGTLCTASTINQWAKCKPFRNSGKIISIADSKDEYDARRYTADCGLKITEYSSLSSLFSAAKLVGERNLAWTYLKPRGLSYGELYRLHDFVGYYHQAKGPFIDRTLSSREGYMIDKVRTVQGSFQRPVGTDDIQKTDLKTLDKTLYIGIATKRSDGTGTMKWAPASDFPQTMFSAYGAEYDVVYFYCTEEIILNTAFSSSARFYMLPYPLTKFARYADFGIEFGGEASGTGTTRLVTLVPYTGLVTRRCMSIKVHTRKPGNVQELSDGCYTITAASSVTSDHEEDVTLFSTDLWLAGNQFWNNPELSGRPTFNTCMLRNYGSGVSVYVEFVYAETDDATTGTSYIRKANIRFPAETSD